MSEDTKRVYRIEFDTRRYQSLSPADEHVFESGQLRFDGTPKGEDWRPLAVRFVNPHLERPNIYYLASGCLVLDRRAIERFHDTLNWGCIENAELLPLSVEGEEWQVVNVTECINVLDSQKTVWKMEHGRRVAIEKYAFHMQRLGVTMPFSIPETADTEILTLEITRQPLDEFKAAVEQAGLKGLKFTELWHGGRWQNARWEETADQP